MLNKLVLSSLIFFLPLNSQLAVGMAWVGLFIGLLLLASPYIRRADGTETNAKIMCRLLVPEFTLRPCLCCADRAQLLAQSEILLLLLAGLIIQRTDTTFIGTELEVILSIVLIAVCVCVVLLILYHATLFWRSAYRLHLRKTAIAKDKARQLAETRSSGSVSRSGSTSAAAVVPEQSPPASPAASSAAASKPKPALELQSLPAAAAATATSSEGSSGPGATSAVGAGSASKSC